MIRRDSAAAAAGDTGTVETGDTLLPINCRLSEQRGGWALGDVYPPRLDTG